ncbi:hypothetical protein [Pseudomonas arsenicoxydans]|uniref:Glucosyl transferase GtrII n=1 Tax=Pseudomonas arsenicoxydans TaxID=702115 RepID=A0A4P6GA67_9PSED|nr:hypothetical protein [Pseudomonas arsenicoxydans]QAY87758.1 hypothetical protein CUN61_29080 [Pseudomonas arsenicoxydans]
MFFLALKRASETISGSLALKIFFVVLAYLSYSIPMIYAYFESVNFIYVNAWDEETYLSYQGALGSLAVPGYWASGAIVYTLQVVGLSGGEINIIFDCLLTPITFFLLVFILRGLNVEYGRALIYATVILFSPILFNFGNPLVSHLAREYKVLGYGWEYYQSVLRTPEPQLSYFFVVLAVAGYLKTRKMLCLFVLLPLLYFYVGISYAYFLVCVFILLSSRFFNKCLNFWRISIACIVSYLVISFGFMIFDFLFLSKDPFIAATPDAYIKSHAPMLPVSGIVTFCLLLLQLALASRYAIKDNKHVHAQFFIVLSLFLICNIHVVSGVMLSYKNYIDYSSSLVAGVGIVVFLDFLRCHAIKGERFVFFVVVSLILYLTFKAYGFSFSKVEYKYFRGLQFNSVEEYKAVSNDPMSIVIQDSDLSAKLPYSVSKMAVPLFSYQYNFPLVANGCRAVLERMEAVAHSLQNGSPSNPVLNFDYFDASIKAFSGQKYVPLELQKDFPANEICKKIPMNGSIKVLSNQFKDDGWIKIKLF